MKVKGDNLPNFFDKFKKEGSGINGSSHNDFFKKLQEGCQAMLKTAVMSTQSSMINSISGDGGGSNNALVPYNDAIKSQLDLDLLKQGHFDKLQQNLSRKYVGNSVVIKDLQPSAKFENNTASFSIMAGVSSAGELPLGAEIYSMMVYISDERGKKHVVSFRNESENSQSEGGAKSDTSKINIVPKDAKCGNIFTLAWDGRDVSNRQVASDGGVYTADVKELKILIRSPDGDIYERHLDIGQRIENVTSVSLNQFNHSVDLKLVSGDMVLEDQVGGIVYNNRSKFTENIGLLNANVSYYNDGKFYVGDVVATKQGFVCVLGEDGMKRYVKTDHIKSVNSVPNENLLKDPAALIGRNVAVDAFGLSDNILVLDIDDEFNSVDVYGLDHKKISTIDSNDMKKPAFKSIDKTFRENYVREIIKNQDMGMIEDFFNTYKENITILPNKESIVVNFMNNDLKQFSKNMETYKTEYPNLFKKVEEIQDGSTTAEEAADQFAAFICSDFSKNHECLSFLIKNISIFLVEQCSSELDDNKFDPDIVNVEKALHKRFFDMSEIRGGSYVKLTNNGKVIETKNPCIVECINNADPSNGMVREVVLHNALMSRFTYPIKNIGNIGDYIS